MATRRIKVDTATLERLLRFVPSEWPTASTVEEAFTAWMAVRRAYAKLHPRSLLGDVVTQLRVELATRRRMRGWTS